LPGPFFVCIAVCCYRICYSAPIRRHGKCPELLGSRLGWWLGNCSTHRYQRALSLVISSRRLATARLNRWGFAVFGSLVPLDSRLRGDYGQRDSALEQAPFVRGGLFLTKSRCRATSCASVPSGKEKPHAFQPNLLCDRACHRASVRLRASHHGVFG